MDRLKRIQFVEQKIQALVRSTLDCDIEGEYSNDYKNGSCGCEGDCQLESIIEVITDQLKEHLPPSADKIGRVEHGGYNPIEAFFKFTVNGIEYETKTVTYENIDLARNAGLSLREITIGTMTEHYTSTIFGVDDIPF